MSIASDNHFGSLQSRNLRSGGSFRSKNSFGNTSHSIIQDAVDDPEFLEQLLGPKQNLNPFMIHEEEDLHEALQEKEKLVTARGSEANASLSHRSKLRFGISNPNQRMSIIS